MGRFGYLAGAAAAVLALGLAAPAVAQQQVRGPHIAVTGEGQVTAKPDMALVQVGVTQRAPEAAGAMDAAGEALDRVLTRLREAGIARADIQTGSLRLYPVYDQRDPGTRPQNEGPQIVAYEAGSTLDVRVRDLEELGGILDEAVGEGANELGGVSFDVADRAPLEDRARRAAVKDAMHRARLYARAAGLEPGRVLSITEQGGGGGPRPMAEASFASDRKMPVASGEIEISQQVRLVLALRGEGGTRQEDNTRPRQAPPKDDSAETEQ